MEKSEYEEFKTPDVVTAPFTGFKSLNVELDDDGQPVLVSPSFRYKWKVGPSVAEGDWDPKGRGVTSAGPGFYTRRTPQILKGEGNWRPGSWPSLLAELDVFGRDTIEEDIGFRSECAEVVSVHEDEYSCQGCDKKKATNAITRKGENQIILLCDDCLGYLKKEHPGVKFQDETLNDLLKKLSSRYKITVRKLI